MGKKNQPLERQFRVRNKTDEKSARCASMWRMNERLNLDLILRSEIFVIIHFGDGNMSGWN